jgi:hypothetical protein
VCTAPCARAVAGTATTSAAAASAASRPSDLSA